MKKSIIALAVAASTMASVAQADGTTLYGRVAYSYDYTKVKGASAISNVRDRGSRFGLRGSNDLGNGLSAVYRLEMRTGRGMDSNVRNRTAMVGLTGGFGTFALGKMGLPYDGVATYSDGFNALSYGGNAISRADNVIAYISPDFNGFSFTVGVVADGANAWEEHVDAYQLTAQYEANGIYAGLGYMRYQDPDDTNFLTVGLGYENDTFGIKFNAERQDDIGPVNPVSFNLEGTYNINEANTVRLRYSKLDPDTIAADTDTIALGYQHNFNKTTRAWAEYSYQEQGSADVSVLSLGLRTNF